MSRANEHISSLAIITSRTSLESSFTCKTLEVPGLGSPLTSSPYIAHSNKASNGQNGGFESQAELNCALRVISQELAAYHLWAMCSPLPAFEIKIGTQMCAFIYVLSMLLSQYIVRVK